jgi:hypothetical protein
MNLAQEIHSTLMEDLPDSDVTVVGERSERYRERAYRTSALLAAATAALAAGLIFSPQIADSLVLVRILGTVTISLLLIATALLVRASLIRAHEPKGRPTNRQLVKASNEVLKRIIRWTDTGLITAAISVIFLVATLAVLTFVPQSRDVSVTVDLRRQAVNFSSCPNLPSSFSATIPSSDLAGVGGLLPSTVDAKTCGAGGSRSSVLYLPRTEVSISRISTGP